MYNCCVVTLYVFDEESGVEDLYPVQENLYWNCLQNYSKKLYCAPLSGGLRSVSNEFPAFWCLFLHQFEVKSVKKNATFKNKLSFCFLQRCSSDKMSKSMTRRKVRGLRSKNKCTQFVPIHLLDIGIFPPKSVGFVQRGPWMNQNFKAIQQVKDSCWGIFDRSCRQTDCETRCECG